MQHEPPEPPVRRFSTRSVHPPRLDPQEGEPIAPLLDLSTTYSFSDTDLFAAASRVKVGEGYVYARWANPTVDAFEAAVADLEGAPAAEAFSSGMAAIACTFLALCRAGDRIASARQLYGNTYSLLTERLPKYGIDTTFAELDDYGALEDACADAKLLYCETIGNPSMRVADIERLAKIAEAAEIPLVVDNTFASPALCTPLSLGASVVVHSATKYLGGHHDLLGGIVCARAPVMTEIRSITRDFGPTFAPFSAWLALRALPTLELRVTRSSDSALRIAEFLEAHPAITAVHYPGLPGSPDHGLAETLLGGRGGGTLAFDVAGGRERATAFQQRLELIAPAASLGGHHSLIVHAASITHTQLSPEELRAAGISEGYCRLSVGLEDLDDLIGDLEQALRA